jgi:carbon monoxide dehydrogenase subunit G
MRLTNSFTVPVPVEQAWDTLLDIERIAPCMPGAALTSHSGDTFEGTVRVKVGPVSLTYKGKGRFVERDEAARRVVISASGADARGAGTAAAKVTASLAPDGDGTRVDVVTDLDVTGRAAQFGRGLIADVSGKLVAQFADCVAGKLGESVPAAVPVAAPAAVPVAATAPAVAPVEPVEDGLGAAPVDERIEAAPVDQGVGTAPPPAPAPVPPPATAPAMAPPATGPPTVPPPATGPPTVPPPATGPATVPPPAKEVEPIDLLQVSGAGAAMRRAVPYIVAAVAGFVVVFALVWLFS